VTFTHPAPGPVDEHRRAFGVEPRFGATENVLELPSAVLALAQRTADPLIGRLVERHARELARQLPVGAGAGASVRALLTRSLSTGASEASTLGAIANEMRMPARTLQRRLAADGTSFAALLDEVRRELALEHLAEPTTSVAEVAFALGFGDQTAFHRAFLRWMGRTPGEYRKGVASGAKPS
jgi:AraC-like DNA-binding protein